MTIAAGFVLGKLGLDALATLGFFVARQHAMGVMFFGFTIADLGAVFLAMQEFR